MDNFENDGALKTGVAPQGVKTEIYKGLRIFLTKNLNKRNDFVNGMSATIEAYDPKHNCLQVMTATGKRLAVFPYTEDTKGGRVTCLPVRLGYAGTMQRIQGMTLEHVTLWLDRAGCRAAAYVAMSRVAYDKDYIIAGPVSVRHFVPAM